MSNRQPPTTYTADPWATPTPAPPPRKPKRRLWRTAGLVALGVLALFFVIGLAAGEPPAPASDPVVEPLNGPTATETAAEVAARQPAPAPTVTETVTETAQPAPAETVTETPQACRDALASARQSFTILSASMALLPEAFTAVQTNDVTTMLRITDEVTANTAELEAVAPTFQLQSAQCEAL